MKPTKKIKLRSAALLAWSFTFQVCIASSSEQFSSSIVTHPDNDISLGSSSSQHRQRQRSQHEHNNDYTTNNNHRADRYHGLKIHRSFIDRDPIYYEELDDDGIIMFDNTYQNYDPFTSHERKNEWQSPLERLAPLPSSSLEPNPHSTSTIDISSSPMTINPGPRHSHEIDITKNNRQEQQQPIKLKTRSTGTTITALLAKNSTVLILAADTRATDGSTVADKRCEKLHTLAQNVWCAGAGTSADVEAMVRRVKFAFWKRGVLMKEGYGGIGNMNRNTIGNNEKSMHYWGSMEDDATSSIANNEDRDVPSASVPAMLHFIRTQLQKTNGNLGVNLLVGGYDHDSHRAHLAAIHPHGSMDVVTYAALGSGGLAATGVLESKYPRIGSGECSVEGGIQLAVDAVRAGIDNDLGSGSQVDVCVISREGVLYRRAVVREEELEWVNLDGDDDASEGDDALDNDIHRMPSGIIASEQNIGVNGFGTVPFAIQSKKIVSGGHVDAERERRRWLDGVLLSEKL